MTKTYKHSGAFGDLIFSLPIVKHFGGGEFYLHLNQMDWIGKHYYGSAPAPFHQGRLRQQDFDSMKSFMLEQPYITKFDILDNNTAISHNLDRFRPLFVGHPGNYITTYCLAFGIKDPATQLAISNEPWLTVNNPKSVEGRPIVINRSERWIPETPGEQWEIWKKQGLESQSVFVGLPEEHQVFCQTMNWNIPHQPTQNMLEVAEYIAGAEKFIGNQSMAITIAIGLGKEYYCEVRRDLPMERNECYFPGQPNANYF
jgi:hypothetical protein